MRPAFHSLAAIAPPSGAALPRAAAAWAATITTGIAPRKGRRAAMRETKDAAAAPGWLAARRPDLFTGGDTLGTGFLARIARMGRVASGWLTTRPSRPLYTTESATHGAPNGAPNSFGQSADAPHYHLPVLPNEVIEALGEIDGKFIIDGTLGGGGHTELMLEAGARVLGIDRDPEAIAHARRRLARFGDRFTAHRADFSEIDTIPALRDSAGPNAILLDLGVSSRQLDAPERGFSFMREGPLDMRMGPDAPHTAAELLATIDEAGLVRILREYGEEPRARRIATAIIARRETTPLATTTDLAAVIERAVGRRSRIHPATRAFQAVRIAVNRELESLRTALDAVPRVLKPGGRLLVITFHSLEDRIVKHHLRERSIRFIDQPGWPEPRPNPDLRYRLISRKAIAPGADEISRNARARSAKLRVAELLPPSP